MEQTEIGEKNVNHSGEMSAGLGGRLTKSFLPSADLNIGRKTQLNTKTAMERKSGISQPRVGTLPNNRWEILEPGRRLRGPYLVSPAADGSMEKPLCRLIVESEEFTIVLSLEVRPDDLDPDITPLEGTRRFPWSPREKPNKSKIAKLLVTKACAECFGRVDDERVTLARAVLHGIRRAVSME
jgi:hypothetical protein